MLRPGGSEADTRWPGDDARDAGHLAIRSGDAVLAVASVIREPHPVDPRAGDWRLRGMATDPAFRRRGYGGLLAQACVEHARQHGGRRVWLHARPNAIVLYERAGFAVQSEEFDVPGLGPHVRMALDL